VFNKVHKKSPFTLQFEPNFVHKRFSVSNVAKAATVCTNTFLATKLVLKKVFTGAPVNPVEEYTGRSPSFGFVFLAPSPLLTYR
jgi:hypothetical protein